MPASTTPAGSTASTAEIATQLRAFANELAELIAAVGGLASAEASLSLTAFLRMLGLRVAGVVLAVLALVLLAVAGTVVLANLLGSAAAALGVVALGALFGAALALWRSAVWRERIGFDQTRAALVAKSPPPDGPAP